MVLDRLHEFHRRFVKGTSVLLKKGCRSDRSGIESCTLPQKIGMSEGEGPSYKRFRGPKVVTEALKGLKSSPIPHYRAMISSGSRLRPVSPISMYESDPTSGRQ